MDVVTVQCFIAAASVAFLVTGSNACSSSNIKDLTFSLTSAFGGGAIISRSMVVPLTSKDMTITGQVTVGTPKQGGKEEVFTLAINLFTPFTWLHSVEFCPPGDCDNEKIKKAGPLKSTTFHRKSRKVDLVVYAEYLQGYISEEKFKFGSGKGAPEAVLEFLEVTARSSGYQGYDGVLGLDLQENYATDAAPAPMVASLFTQFKEAVVGFYIYKTPKNNEHGLMIMGGNDAGLINEPLHSHNVLRGRNGELSGWNIKLDKLLIINTDGTREELTVSMNTASLALASDDIGVPRQEFIRLTNIILQKAGVVSTDRTFVCEKYLKALPSIALVMDGVEYVLTPEDFVRRSTTQINMCDLAFEYSIGGRRMSLGKVFMKRYYTRLNIKDKQVQFALAKQGL